MLSFNLTLVIEMVSFLVFAWLFNLVFFRPIVSHIEARNRFLVDQQVKADDLVKSARQLQEDHFRKVGEAQREAQRAIDQAIKEAQARRGQELAQVQAEGRKMVEDARAQLAGERDALASELRTEVAGLARAITGRVAAGAGLDVSSRSREGAQA